MRPPLATELTKKERQRQIDFEDWSIEHDDTHVEGELGRAAYCYSLDSSQRDLLGRPPEQWPWDDKWWKPTPDDRIKELVKAGALYRAEIERLERALTLVHLTLATELTIKYIR